MAEFFCRFTAIGELHWDHHKSVKASAMESVQSHPNKSLKKAEKKKEKSLKLIWQMNITIALINKKEIIRCFVLSEPWSHLTVNDEIMLSIDENGFDPPP